MIRLYVFSVPLLLLLAACATLDETACTGGDWFAIGERDGAAGRDQSYITNHAKACAKHGIAPNQTDWERGRNEGLKLYCTPERAFENGSRGRRLNLVCPSEGLDTLIRANRRGLDLHEVNEEIDEIEDDIEDINDKLLAMDTEDPNRASLARERSQLRLDLLRLRARRARLI